MGFSEVPFSDLLCNIVDNRGMTCPTVDAGVPLIATNCIRNELLYPTYDKVRFVSPQTYSTWFRDHPIAGDILFVNKATPGRVCLVPDPVDFCIAQDMVAVRADSAKVYPKFLFAALRSPAAQKQIQQMHVGTLIPHFKKGDFNKLLLPFPNRDLQEFIGDLYFDLSAKIDLNRQMNGTLEAIVRAIFKSWFVDFDPVHAKAEGRNRGLPGAFARLFPDSFDRSDLSEIPTGWQHGTLADLSTLNPESWSKATRPALIRYVDLSNTKRGRIESIATYAREDAPSRAQRVLRVGDTIVGTVRPGNGSFALVFDAGLTASTGFAVLRPQSSACTEFVYIAATAAENIESLSHLADGGAYPAVRPEVVAATPIVKPNRDALGAFSLIAGSLLGRHAWNERESRTLAALRDALLPKLITGAVSPVCAEQRLREALA